MKSLENNKAVVIAVIVFIFAIIGYNYFFAASATSVASESDAAAVIGNQVVGLEAKLRAVTLDTSLFSSKIYASLVDFAPVLPPSNPGRPNPFLPIGE
jgi:predicted negative regulator of RcsB-dependent stress response